MFASYIVGAARTPAGGAREIKARSLGFTRRNSLRKP